MQGDDEVKVIQHGQSFIVHIGALVISYDATIQAWHVRLPGHEQAEQPLQLYPYCWPTGGLELSVEHDQAGMPVGIEILTTR